MIAETKVRKIKKIYMRGRDTDNKNGDIVVQNRRNGKHVYQGQKRWVGVR